MLPDAYQAHQKEGMMDGKNTRNFAAFSGWEGNLAEHVSRCNEDPTLDRPVEVLKLLDSPDKDVPESKKIVASMTLGILRQSARDNFRIAIDENGGKQVASIMYPESLLMSWFCHSFVAVSLLDSYIRPLLKF
jgi:hypothetical protein